MLLIDDSGGKEKTSNFPLNDKGIEFNSIKKDGIIFSGNLFFISFLNLLQSTKQTLSVE